MENYHENYSSSNLDVPFHGGERLQALGPESYLHDIQMLRPFAGLHLLEILRS